MMQVSPEQLLMIIGELEVQRRVLLEKIAELEKERDVDVLAAEVQR